MQRTFFITIALLLFASIQTISQENKQVSGTIFIRSIQKDKSLPGDSAMLSARFFLLGCHPLQMGPYAEPFIRVGTNSFRLPQNQQELAVRTRAGKTPIMVSYPGSASFHPLSSRVYRFRKKHIYHINIYLAPAETYTLQ